MIYAYARISTPAQKLERQVENLLRAEPTAKLFKESFTGRSLHRPEWVRLTKVLKTGDVVVFDEVSRMSRSAEEGIATYEELFNKGIELRFLKEPHINTETYRSALNNSINMTGTQIDFIIDGINKYLMALAREQIRIAFEQAEKEVEFLRNRTKEGLRIAKENGQVLGRREGSVIKTKKSIATKEIIIKHSKTFGGSLSDAEVIKLCGVSRNSYYRFKKQLVLETSFYTNRDKQ